MLITVIDRVPSSCPAFCAGTIYPYPPFPACKQNNENQHEKNIKRTRPLLPSSPLHIYHLLRPTTTPSTTCCSLQTALNCTVRGNKPVTRAPTNSEGPNSNAVRKNLESSNAYPISAWLVGVHHWRSFHSCVLGDLQKIFRTSFGKNEKIVHFHHCPTVQRTLSH